MRVALVSLPWSAPTRPAAAVGTLAAYLRQQAPAFDVVADYAYMHLAIRLGRRVYTDLSNDCYALGELLYLPFLYPERRTAVATQLARALARRCAPQSPEQWCSGWQEAAGVTDWDEVTRLLLRALDEELERSSERLEKGFDLVGFTTCFGQLFANLSLCQRLKARASDLVTVLGGSTISARVGPSVLAEYPQVDFLVQGEGEQPLLALARALDAGAAPHGIAGVLTRRNASHFPNGAALWEVADLDQLPVPHYDEFAALADAGCWPWDIPIEGSRGCWWDRVKQTGDPKNTCYFCNLNVQWRGYRQKSEARLVREVDTLTDRYAKTNVFFLDNIIRHKGIEALATALRGLGKTLTMFYEMRANVRPWQLLQLNEAGVDRVQFGIEAFSTSLLSRIGKGTTTIQNFEVMKTCEELGIDNAANLIIDFPGSTDDEVKETRENILRHAICWQPLDISSFQLGVGSTVESLPAAFGLKSASNAEFYQLGLPMEVWQRLQLSDLSFELKHPGCDWSPVREACRDWKQRREAAGGGVRRRALLEYHDGKTFLRICDRRGPDADHVLRDDARDVYLYCCAIRSRAQILEKFAADDVAESQAIDDFLARMVALGIMYREGQKFLALACAPTREAAAERIRGAV